MDLRIKPKEFSIWLLLLLFIIAVSTIIYYGLPNTVWSTICGWVIVLLLLYSTAIALLYSTLTFNADYVAQLDNELFDVRDNPAEMFRRLTFHTITVTKITKT